MSVQKTDVEEPKVQSIYCTGLASSILSRNLETLAIHLNLFGK